MTRLEEIKARVDAATEGPWESVSVMPAGESLDKNGNVVSAWGESDWTVLSGPPQVIQDAMLTKKAFTRKADTQFISHARSDIPWLFKYLETACKLLPCACRACKADGKKLTCIACVLKEEVGFIDETSKPKDEG